MTIGIPRDSQCQYLVKCVGDQRRQCATILIWHCEALVGSAIWHILAHRRLWSSHALWHNMHLVLLQHIEDQVSVPHLYTASRVPRPSHRPIFDCLQCNQKLDNGKTWNEANLQLQSVYGKWNWHEETTHELTRAVLATVAQKLQQERALLLPHAVSSFLDNCPQAKDNEGM